MAKIIVEDKETIGKKYNRSAASKSSSSARMKFRLTVTSLLIITINAPINEAAVIQAIIEIDGSPEEFVKIILERMDHLIDSQRNMAHQLENANSGDTKPEFSSNTGSSSPNITPFTPFMNVGVMTKATTIGRAFTIRGNITDKKNNPSSVIRFQFYTERDNKTVTDMKLRSTTEDGSKDFVKRNEDYYKRNAEENGDDDDDDNEETEDPGWFQDDGGIFEPIVKMVEPYVVALLNIIFHGILTSVISKIMDNANMTGDIRLA